MENNSLLPSLYSTLLQEMDKNPLAYIAKYKQPKGEPEYKRQWIELVLAQGYVFCYFSEMAIALCEANIDKLHNHPENVLLPFFLMVKATAQSMLSQTELMHKTLETAEGLLIKPFSVYPGLTIKMLWAIYYLYVQKPIPAEMYAMKVIESLDKVKDPQISAYLLWKLGSFYNRLRKYDLAFAYLVRAYDVCEQYNLKLQRLILSIDLISVNAHLQKFDLAEKLFKQAGKLSRELGISSYEIGINFNYGLLNKIRENIPEAIKYYLISLEILNEAGLDIPSTEFNIYNNLANAYSQNKDFDLALECFKKVAEIAERIGNLDLQMQVSNNIGLNLVAQKRYDEALPLIKKAISHFRKMKNWELLTKAIRTEAFLYQETKQYRRGFLAMDKLDQVRTKHLIQIQNR